MVGSTVGKIGRNLERLMRKHLSVQAAFSVLERRARTVEELVVIEVMREANDEMSDLQHRMAS